MFFDDFGGSLSEFGWLTRCGRAQIQNKRFSFNVQHMLVQLSVNCPMLWQQIGARWSKTKSKNYFHVI